MRLVATDPVSWLSGYAQTLFPDHLSEGGAEGYRLCSTDDLVEHVLGAAVDDLLAEGAPRATAGMLLAGSWAGLVAWSLGFGLLGADAALVVAPEAVSYWRHPDGYPDALELDHVAAAVSPEHPWAGLPGILVLEDRRLVAQAATRSMVTAVGPLVETLHRLTRAGRVGLWHEVADAFASVTVHQRAIAITPADLTTLAEALDLAGAPWRRRARLQLLPDANDSTCVLHKAGCCLAFRLPDTGSAETDDDHRAFAEAFPADLDAPAYCVSCKFRSFEESARMHLWWREREAATSPAWPAP